MNDPMEITVCFDLPSGDGDGTNAEAAAADAFVIWLNFSMHSSLNRGSSGRQLLLM